MSLGINLDIYKDLPNNGEGAVVADQTSQETLNDLTKALEAGHETGRDLTNESGKSGAPLKIESLDATLKILEFKEREIVVWKRIPKSPAYNTVEEYNQLDSFGADTGGFVPEGVTPEEQDSSYVRRAELVKYLGITKSVTHVMTLVNAVVANKIALEAKNGTLWLMRKANRSIIDGDSRIVPDSFNGMYAQHARPDGVNLFGGSQKGYVESEGVIDLRGDYLKEEYIEDAQESIIQGHGLANELFAPPKVFSDFSKGFYGQKRHVMGSAEQQNGYSGLRLNGHDTEFGRVDFAHDIFMNKPISKTSTSVRTSLKSPEAPVADATTPIAAVAIDTSGKWTADDTGDYLYAVTAINRYGESSPTVLSATPTTIATGGSVDVKFAAAGSGEAATAYFVYRGEKDVSGAATKFYKVFEISAGELASGFDGGAAGIVRDRNNFLPNTSQAFLIENDPQIWTFRQLAPLMKMDLAIISPAYRFMMLLYGTPILFARQKMTRIINIGTFTTP